MGPVAGSPARQRQNFSHTVETGGHFVRRHRGGIQNMPFVFAEVRKCGVHAPDHVFLERSFAFRRASQRFFHADTQDELVDVHTL